MEMIDAKIKKNYERMESDTYATEALFQKSDYSWPGDFEGRGLLAFCCHYKMGNPVPWIHETMRLIKNHINSQGYFGAEFDGVAVNEQQLSGHSWFLCGLVEYYKLFHDPIALDYAKRTIENLYLPALSFYDHYPVCERVGGEVSGNIIGTAEGWKLSTDVGCAFMCVDGLARYYVLTEDSRVKQLLDKIIQVFCSVDFIGQKYQTHTTLTCLRGMLDLYEKTGDEKMFREVLRVFELYQKNGMTLTYQNYNWFGREDTWTEPCAIVDSLILSLRLYKITKEDKYRVLARRIWFNGMSIAQRSNGGAGPNICVREGQPFLYLVEHFYEAFYCCSMRYAEGLLYAEENADLLADEPDGLKAERDSFGRIFYGDKMLVKDMTGIFRKEKQYWVDGEQYIAIPSLTQYTKEENLKARFQCIF